MPVGSHPNELNNFLYGMQFDWPCLTKIELNLDENNIIRSSYQKQNNIVRSGFGQSKLYTSITYCLNACLLHKREVAF